MGRRIDAASFQDFLAQWRGPARFAAGTLGTADGRWALVSTSITAAIAGAIALLAAGTMPATTARLQAGQHTSLLPYQLFLRLASGGDGINTNYAGFGSAGPVTRPPSAAQAYSSDSSDNALAAEQLDDSDQQASADTRTITLGRGDTLVGALTDAGVSTGDANAAVVALARIYNMHSLRAGQSLDLTFVPAATAAPTAQITYTPPNQAADDDDSDGDDSSAVPAAPAPLGKLLAVSFSPTVDQQLTIARNADDSFTAQGAVRTLQSRYHRAGGTIDSSLYLAAMRAGIPADVVVQMIHIFSYEVDFKHAIRPGDTFQILYTHDSTPNGNISPQSVIDYAALTLGGKTYSLYRYQPEGSGDVDYLDPEGRSARSLLMRRPVYGGRITSGFGWRVNPITGGPELHKGVDIAVPVGTPVMAAGSGTIQYEGPARGYGNFLLIKHNNEYSTAYGHLSHFSKGTHIGSHVQRGQVVAYSGDTGESTGPHLHYEIRVAGKQVNPLTVKVAYDRSLQGRALKAFLAQRAHMDAEIAALPLVTKVADNTSTDLRAAKD